MKILNFKELSNDDEKRAVLDSVCSARLEEDFTYKRREHGEAI